MATGADGGDSLRAAMRPAALRAALIPSRPVFSNPWDSEADMFACVVAVSALNPFLLWAGGELMSSIFGFGSHWRLGVFMVASVVGAAGFITIVGRQRTRLAVDFLTIAAWIVLGLVVAPVIGLAPSTTVAIILYAVLLVGIFVYVVLFGQWETGFVRTVSWPITWTALAVLFAFLAYRLLIYQ